jgi:hypothetical protein
MEKFKFLLFGMLMTFSIANAQFENDSDIVEQIEFDGELDNIDAHLTWVSPIGKDDSFILERSYNERGFSAVPVHINMFVTNKSILYTVKDKGLLEGLYHYRLKHRYYNGDIRYSEIVIINNNYHH